MAPLLEDPRIRQTWNHISQNAETATESAATGLWTFTHTYINPCLSSVSTAFQHCAGNCIPDREERARRLRERSRTRGRAEFSFDFYDDWDEDNEGGGNSGLLGWGNDELDRLLVGSGAHSDEQPSGKARRMSYGTKGGRKRKKTMDGLPDPTIIPSTNSFGFLQRLPWKFGGTLRYKPSAADLQEHPGTHRVELGDERGPLIDDGVERIEEADENSHPGHSRNRSSTAGSGDTTDSFRSRGDLFPSDGEDDAVPLGDEFAMVLERRITGLSGTDDRSSGKTRTSKGKKRAGSRAMSRTTSGVMELSQDSSAARFPFPELSSTNRVEQPSVMDLHEEEARLRKQEETEVEQKRQAAAILARERGLTLDKNATPQASPTTHVVENTIINPSLHVDSSKREIAALAPETQYFKQTANTSQSQFIPARLPKF